MSSRRTGTSAVAWCVGLLILTAGPTTLATDALSNVFWADRAIELVRDGVTQVDGIYIGRSTLPEIAHRFGLTEASVVGEPPNQALCLTTNFQGQEVDIVLLSSPSPGYEIASSMYVLWDATLMRGIACVPARLDESRLQSIAGSIVAGTGVDIQAVRRRVRDTIEVAHEQESSSETGSIDSWSGLAFGPDETVVFTVDLPCGFHNVVRTVSLEVRHHDGTLIAFGIGFSEESY